MRARDALSGDHATGLAAAHRPFRLENRGLALRCWLACRAIRLLAHALFRLDVAGLEQLPAGNYIVAANHVGWADPFILIAVWPQPERLRFIGAREVVFGALWKAALVNASGLVIPLRRGEGDRAALVGALRALAAGWNLVVFPEGRVGPHELDPLPFRRGAAFLALRTGRPLVPVALAGTQDLYRGKRLLVRVGAPIWPPAGRGRRAEAALTAACEQAVRALLPRQLPPDPPHKPWHFLRRLL
jgi:1-acyl-sn-glycerol-3-phosphate acyltransferase